jgi:hypothetical protein
VTVPGFFKKFCFMNPRLSRHSRLISTYIAYVNHSETARPNVIDEVALNYGPILHNHFGATFRPHTGASIARPTPQLAHNRAANSHVKAKISSTPSVANRALARAGTHD